MPYFRVVEYDQLTLPTNKDYWVKMKKRGEYGDRRAAQDKMITMQVTDGEVVAESPDGTVLTRSEVGTYNTTLIQRMIVEWNLDGPDGQVQPITPENIDKLDPEDGDFLAAEAAKRTKAAKVVPPGQLPLPRPQPSTTPLETANT